METKQSTGVMFVLAVTMLTTTYAESVCDLIAQGQNFSATSMFIYDNFLYVFNDQQYFRVLTSRLNPTGSVLLDLREVEFIPSYAPNGMKHIALVNYMCPYMEGASDQDILLRAFPDKYELTFIQDRDVLNPQGKSYTHVKEMYEEFFETTEASTILTEDGTQGFWCFNCGSQNYFIVCCLDVSTFYKEVILGIAQNPIIRLSHAAESYRFSNSTRLVTKELPVLDFMDPNTMMLYYPNKLSQGFIYQGLMFIFELERQTLTSVNFSDYLKERETFGRLRITSSVPIKEALCPTQVRASETLPPPGTRTTFLFDKVLVPVTNVPQGHSVLILIVFVLGSAAFFICLLNLLVRVLSPPPSSSSSTSPRTSRHHRQAKLKRGGTIDRTTLRTLFRKRKLRNRVKVSELTRHRAHKILEARRHRSNEMLASPRHRAPKNFRRPG